MFHNSTLSILSDALERPSNIPPLHCFLNRFLFILRTTSIVDLLDLYACCLSSVHMIVMGVNLFAIIVARILYMLCNRAINLKLLRRVLSPFLYMHIIIPIFHESIIPLLYVSLNIFLIYTYPFCSEDFGDSRWYLAHTYWFVIFLRPYRGINLFWSEVIIYFPPYHLCFIRYPYRIDVLLPDVILFIISSFYERFRLVQAFRWCRRDCFRLYCASYFVYGGREFQLVFWRLL